MHFKRFKAVLLSFLIAFNIFAADAFAVNRYLDMIIRYDYSDHRYNAEEVFVAIDGRKLTNLPMPPIIFNGYTLVPAREVFEGVGAEVTWIKDLEQVYVKFNGKVIVIPIDSSKAYVDGVAKDMNTKAKIINDKTMIPTRFVTTALGFEIEWDKVTRIANIVTKPKQQQTTVAAATTTTKAATTAATTTTEAATETTTKAKPASQNTQTTKPQQSQNTTVAQQSSVSSQNYDKFGYDNAAGQLYIRDGAGSINVDNITHLDNYYNLTYTLVIYGNYTNLMSSTSFTPTTDGIKNVSVAVSDDRTTITFNETKIMAMDVTSSDGYVYIRPVPPKQKYSKIIVLDAGHGGSDPGASGNNLVEKNLTLNMLLAAKKLFDESDIKCYVTRDSDVYPSFNERTNLGNEVGDAFISIHINSVERNSTASGTETYSLYANDQGNGLTSYRLAEEMLNQLLAKLGTVNRDVKSESWIVLTQSKIPATLIEIGFITNPGDAAIMGSVDGTNKVGQAIFDGVNKLFSQYPPVR